jgi:tetratricopeptide (TPR) repeat protein
MIYQRIPPTLVALISLLTFVLLSAGCSDVAKQLKITSNLSEALTQAQIDKTDLAKQWVDRAIKVDPNDADIYVSDPDPQTLANLTEDQVEARNIAAIFTTVGDDRTLEYYMVQGAQKFPGNYLILQVLAETQGRLGETAQQAATAKKLVTVLQQKITNPGIKGYSDLLLALGQAYYDSGDVVNGEKTFRSFIKAYPTNPDGTNGLAFDFAVTNNKPKLPEALSLANLALATAEKQNKGDWAIGSIQDTIGWVQYRQGDFKDAAATLLEATTNCPRVAEIHYHLGMANLALNNKLAARASFNHALRLNKDYADANSEFAKLKDVTAPPPPDDTAI